MAGEPIPRRGDGTGRTGGLDADRVPGSLRHSRAFLGLHPRFLPTQIDRWIRLNFALLTGMTFALHYGSWRVSSFPAFQFSSKGRTRSDRPSPSYSPFPHLPLPLL